MDVDTNWANLDDTHAALNGVPATAARLALMHNPVTFKSFGPGKAPLAVAGHTHCSQLPLRFNARPQVTIFELRGE